MMADYMGYGRPGYGAPGQGTDIGGMHPTYDVWGIVLAASDNTAKGCVRVKVRTMADKQDTFDSVPVLTGYGGGDYGLFILPEEGDVVRLTFLGGDFRHPVVSGCRFPENSSLVGESWGKENLNKTFKVKNGSRVTFSGEKGKEKIEVSGPKQMKWGLDEDQQQIVFGDQENKNQMLLDKKNGSAQIQSEQSILLECGKSSLELKKDGTMVLKCEKLTLEAKNIEIKGKSKVQVEGQSLSMEGTTGISMTGKGQVKVESKGTLKLSGTMIQLN